MRSVVRYRVVLAIPSVFRIVRIPSKQSPLPIRGRGNIPPRLRVNTYLVPPEHAWCESIQVNLHRAGDTLQISFQRPPSSYAAKSGLLKDVVDRHGLMIDLTSGVQRTKCENQKCRNTNAKMQKCRNAEMQSLGPIRGGVFLINSSWRDGREILSEGSRRAMPLVRCFLLRAKH